MIEVVYKFILILMLWLILTYLVLLNIKQDKIIERQESVASKLEYQNSMIANTVQKSIEEQFNNWFDCNLIDK